jgi:methylated-DNA-[protein]-cysteine S-methyltransferase
VTETIPSDIDERFRAAAAAEGLLDVAYDVFDDTAVGPLLVGVTEVGVCRISFDPDPERELELLARLYGPRVLRSSRPVDRLHRELDEYLEGRRRTFDVEPDLRVQPDYYRRVLAELAQVGYGETTTYGTLAARSGNPRAARAVGTVMNRNPVPILLPCHRVVGANGSLTGYGGGLHRKEMLLRLEGSLQPEMLRISG